MTAPNYPKPQQVITQELVLSGGRGHIPVPGEDYKLPEGWEFLIFGSTIEIMDEKGKRHHMEVIPYNPPPDWTRANILKRALTAPNYGVPPNAKT